MALSLITAAAALPVTLAQVRTYCRIEDARFDALLDDLRRAAVGMVEEYLGRSVGEQTWRLTLDAFADAIELPRGPVLGLVADSFKYVDITGAPVVVPPELYTLDTVTQPSWIVRNEGESWPETIDAVNVVQVDFTTGWTETTMPAPLRTAVCMIAQAWFDGETGNLPPAAEVLLSPYRTLWIAA